MILALFWIVLGLWQWQSGINTPLAWLEPDQETLISNRIFSVFGNPNVYALILVVQISLSSTFLSEKASTIQNFFNGIILLLSLFSLLLTFSRGAWLLAALVLILQSRYRLGIGACLLLFLPFHQQILQRFGSLHAWNYRTNIWRETLRAIDLSDGIGTSFINIYTGLTASHAHQFYLQLWLEDGWAVLVFFIFSMIYLLKLSQKTVCSRALHRSLQCFLLYGFWESWQKNVVLTVYFLLISSSLWILAQEEFK